MVRGRRGGRLQERDREREHSPISDALYDVDVYVHVRIYIGSLAILYLSCLRQRAVVVAAF